jgi:hypothetical protein
MTLKEKKDMCSRALIAWSMMEHDSKDLSIHDRDCEEIFTSQVLLKKFKVFDINIVLPDMLLVILSICTDNNPGQVQIVLKDLLNHIKKVRGSIQAGYVITSMDFATCFPMNFPIIEIPEINEKYNKLWDEQKKQGKVHPFESDNLCDTPEWWKEVME